MAFLDSGEDELSKLLCTDAGRIEHMERFRQDRNGREKGSAERAKSRPAL
jgi:hypothetical protein